MITGLTLRLCVTDLSIYDNMTHAEVARGTDLSIYNNRTHTEPVCVTDLSIYDNRTYVEVARVTVLPAGSAGSGIKFIAILARPTHHVLIPSISTGQAIPGACCKTNT